MASNDARTDAGLAVVPERSSKKQLGVLFQRRQSEARRTLEGPGAVVDDDSTLRQQFVDLEHVLVLLAGALNESHSRRRAGDVSAKTRSQPWRECGRVFER